MSFVRKLRGNGIVQIAAGAGVGQLIAVAAAPLLSRIYEPRDFGDFVVLSSIALALGTVMSLRLESAVPLPDDHDDARSLVRISAVCAAVVATIAFGLLVAFESTTSQWLGIDLSTSMLVGTVATAMAIAAYRILNQWALRHRRYALAGRRSIIQSIVTVTVQVAAGMTSVKHGLLLGMGAGQAAGAAGLIGAAPLRYQGMRPRKLKILYRYRSFPLLLAPSTLLNTAGIYAPLIVFAALYGPVAAGLLGFAQRVLAMPVTLIGQSVAQVYLAELAQSRRAATDSGHRMFFKTSRRLAAIGVLGALVLAILGPPLFSITFGEDWRDSGRMAQALGLMLAAQLVASSLSQTLVVLERTGTQMAWDAFRLVFTVGSVLLAYRLGSSALVAVWCLSLAGTAAYAVSWELSRRALDTTS